MDANCTFPKWQLSSDGGRYITGGAIMDPKSNHSGRMQADLLAWVEAHHLFVPSTFAGNRPADDHSDLDYSSLHLAKKKK